MAAPGFLFLWVLSWSLKKVQLITNSTNTFMLPSTMVSRTSCYRISCAVQELLALWSYSHFCE